MRGERGAATVEWTGLVLVVAAVLGAATVVAGGLHAGSLARSIRCAVLAGCRGEDRVLAAAYGDDVAGQVRAWAPGFVYEPGTLTLPVDFRRCRAHRCADAPDARGEDVWRSATGESRATVFTHVVDRRRRGGPLYLQYWLYYPDSTYAGGAYAVSRARVVRDTPLGALAGKAAGHHEDDWESYQLKLMPDGRVFVRASAHNGYAGRRRWPNLNELPGEPKLPRVGRNGVSVEPRHRTGAWTPYTGWTRVTRGSHAGHIPDGPRDGERRTEADGVTLVPIERLSEGDIATSFAITPPWRNPVYAEPERTDT
jgi:hypothetical protein